MTYMDEYAILLKSKSDYTKLNKLVHDMLHIDPARPETCVALAAMWERKDERKALTYAEKVHTFLLAMCFMEAHLPSTVPYDIFLFIRASELMIGI